MKTIRLAFLLAWLAAGASRAATPAPDSPDARVTQWRTLLAAEVARGVPLDKAFQDLSAAERRKAKPYDDHERDLRDLVEAYNRANRDVPLPPRDVATKQPKAAAEAVHESAGRLRNMVRLYEPNQAGWTKDSGDGGFMDFTFSMQFPAFHRHYPDLDASEQWWLTRHVWQPLQLYPYFAATIRAGQYIETRPSSPVVGKRFNPLLALRHWFPARNNGLALPGYIEAVYAHESNGQSITTPQAFAAQRQIFLQSESARNTLAAQQRADLSARDMISRGWDYVGLQFTDTVRIPSLLGRTRDGRERFLDVTLQARAHHYLSYGRLQKDAEEYNPWENDPQGKPRSHVDGLSARVSLQTFAFGVPRVAEFDGRLGIAWNTGVHAPFRHNTWKAELGLRIGSLPFFVWYRRGFNSDLIDYYRRDASWGVMASFWEF